MHSKKITAAVAALGLGLGVAPLTLAKGGGGGTNPSGHTISITFPGAQSGTVGSAANVQIRATDSARTSLTYAASGLPAGMSINSSTGAITGTPTAAGSLDPVITVTDSSGAMGQVAFFWTVSAGTSNSANLIVNGGPTTGLWSQSGFDDMSNPGWTITEGNPQMESYQNTDADPVSTAPGHQSDVTAFFHGGNYQASSEYQVADVSAAASAIDAGAATYDLSGWLGGYSSQNETVQLTAGFLDASGTQISAATIGPVTAAMRNNVTELLSQQASGSFPVGTRSIKFVLSFATSTGDSTTDGYAQDLSFTTNQPTLTAPTLTPPASTVPSGFQHVFVIYMENENYSSASDPNGGAGIIGNPSAPYINSLLSQGSLLTNYHALSHNSDENYYGMASGSTFGHSAGGSAPAANGINTFTFSGPNLSTEVENAGLTWKQYIQSEPSNCDYANSGNYESDDSPFGYFANMKNGIASGYCAAHWQNLTQLTGTDLKSAAATPNFVWGDADSCSDMENCGVATGDSWLSTYVPQILSSPAWTTQKSLLLITWDEDGTNAPGGFGAGNANQVATLVLGSQGSVKTNYQSGARYDHYSLTRMIESALGLPAMTYNDEFATPINDVF
jgi:hypothetical protein